MNLSDKTQFCAKSFTPIRVSSKLIRGQSVSNPITIYNLKKQGVNQIIDLRNLSTEKTQIIPIFFERLFCKIFKIKYINTKYSHKLEGMPSNSFFNNINNLILNNSEQTYIHCRHGKRRTGVCVAVFEMFHTDKNKSEILNNLYKIGFKELNLKLNNRISVNNKKRLITIFNNFIDKFCKEYKNYKINT